LKRWREEFTAHETHRELRSRVKQVQLVVEARRVRVVKLERTVAEDKEKVVGPFSKNKGIFKSHLGVIG